MAIMGSDTLRIFVSYSHENDDWVRQGPNNLIPLLEKALKRDQVEFWCDPELRKMPGEKYRDIIEQEIDAADIALLLISENFVISEFIRDVELPRIKKRFDRREISIIPILVGHVDWEGDAEYKWLTDLQIIPGKPTPLIDYVADPAKWSKVQVEILEALRGRVQRIRRQQQGTKEWRGRNREGERQGYSPRLRSKAAWITLGIASLVVIGGLYGLFKWSGSKTFAIIEPQNGSVVERECAVSGTAPRGITDVWLVVKPVGTDEFWIQPNIPVKDGMWAGRAYIGGEGFGDLGKKFKIRALGGPLEILREGDVLGNWPSANHISPVIEIQRKGE